MPRRHAADRRSHGLENLLKTRLEDGILGNFAFNANGDTTGGAVRMYRIERGRERVLDVITPPASLG